MVKHWQWLVLSLCLKLLLFPTTPSTDYDVHCHWKTLTHTTSLSNWYVDTSSKWTLDYPPLFAYFEYALSYLCHPPSFTFMRLTVLLLDPLFFYSILSLSNSASNKSSLPLPLTLLSPGVFLIDSIHFQYNILPLSFLLLTLSALLSNRALLAVILFSLTLNLKHTLLPLAPPIAVYLLRTTPLSKFPLLVLATISTFALLWLPFYLSGGVPLFLQILHRLFPFDRGLLHAYWAPNIWALYAIADKVCQRLGLSTTSVDVDITRGIIGARRPFAVLPNPTPVICASILLAVLLPLLYVLYKQPRKLTLITGMSALTGFLVGWHVHEKAILVALVPLLGCVGEDQRVAQGVLWVSIGGHLGLFPLVNELAVQPYKILHFIAFHVAALNVVKGGRRRLLWAYLGGGVLVEIYGRVVHRILWRGRMEFLPIMMMSGYAAVGIVTGFVTLMRSLVAEMRKVHPD